MIPRDYQHEAKAAVLRTFERFDSALLVMATGLGKTVVFAHLAHDWTDRRVMILAHRTELIQQAGDKILAVTGERPAVEMGDERACEESWVQSKIVLASIQTLANARRRSKFDASGFGLVIVDEAHHAVAKSYKDVLDHFGTAKRLGVTATAKRGDGVAMGRMFDEVAFEYGILEGKNDGWLVPVRQRVVVVEGLDFSRVRQTCGELNEGDLEAVMTQEGVLHRVAAPACELIGKRPTLVFCVNVKHAKLMSGIINRYRDGAARWLSGESPEGERRDTVEAFRRGELPILCNCGLFVEGFDAPCCAAVVMARPTKSLALYTQMLGRGTRTHDCDVDKAGSARARRSAIARSGKPDLLVLDFAGNAGRHKIIAADDLLGGNFSEAARARHKERPPEDEDEETVEDALERNQEEIDLEAEQEEWRKKVKAAAKFTTYEESPFNESAGEQEVETYIERPTPRMRASLLRAGYAAEYVDTLTKKKAGFLIGRAKKAEIVTHES